MSMDQNQLPDDNNPGGEVRLPTRRPPGESHSI
jgi:hypothetical protein